MKTRVPVLILLALAVALGAGAGPDQDPQPAPEPRALPPAADPAHEKAAEVPDILTADPKTLSPMLREIVATWKAQDVALAALEADLAVATDHTRALALQRQIEDLRTRTEVQILRIQANHARQAGRLEQAAQIERALAVITTPAPRGVPADRSAPRDLGR